MAAAYDQSMAMSHARLAVVALAGALLLTAGCTSSGHTAAVSTSTSFLGQVTSTTSTTTPTPTLPPPIPETLGVTVDRDSATVGDKVRVHATGCTNADGSTAGVTALIAMLGAGSDPPQVGHDGSFEETLVVSGSVPPGTQSVVAQCFGSPSATMTTGTQPMGQPISQGHATLQITATALTGVTPKLVPAGSNIVVRGQCSNPGSTYEYFVVWLARPGEDFGWPPSPSDDSPPATGYAPNGSTTTTTDPHDGLPPSRAVTGGDCSQRVSTATITVPAGLAPGTYFVHAATYAERPPVQRWFQPVEVTVTSPT
jgi:hypothetical protein